MARKPIKVHVVEQADREHLVLRYVDPVTGKQRKRTSGTSDRKEAERAAARWEDELVSGKFKPAADLTWQEFRDRFEDEHLRFLSDAYFNVFQAALNKFESVTELEHLEDVGSVLNQFELSLRRSTLSANSVRTYIKHLKVCLDWGVSKGLLDAVNLVLPDAPDEQAKGRALTEAEFQSMLMAVPSVVGEKHADGWRHYLRGLWYSGLRRTESLNLSWDATADFCVDLSGLYPRFKIRAAGQKSRKAQLCAMAKDCADFLLSNTPAADRVGLVFCPVGKQGRPMTSSEVGRTVAAISTAAEVFTDPDQSKPAGCHDLRRSFGTRWASVLMPVDLKALMRHADIETTLKFYVGSDADTLSARIWARMQDSETTAAKTAAE